MPKRVVTIEWDDPDNENWLNDDNIAIALGAYCPNTRFAVSSAKPTSVVCSICGGPSDDYHGVTCGVCSQKILSSC